MIPILDLLPNIAALCVSDSADLPLFGHRTKSWYGFAIILYALCRRFRLTNLGIPPSRQGCDEAQADAFG